jgi:L-lactate dehydrogenase complex protein LldG
MEKIGKARKRGRARVMEADMAEAVSHRSIILTNIRKSLGEAAPPASIAEEYVDIQRTYIRRSNLESAGRIELFVNRLDEYDAGVYRANEAGIASAVAGILEARSKSELLIPSGVPESWLPERYRFIDAQAFDAYELDGSQGILTGCTVAIAETGTIVLQNAPAQGARMLSLVPDYHLCVVFAQQIVATVPEAFGVLSTTSTLPTTFISGPSATADIEMTRIKGVHGPRFLDVLIVE